MIRIAVLDLTAGVLLTVPASIPVLVQQRPGASAGDVKSASSRFPPHDSEQTLERFAAAYKDICKIRETITLKLPQWEGTERMQTRSCATCARSNLIARQLTSRTHRASGLPLAFLYRLSMLTTPNRASSILGESGP